MSKNLKYYGRGTIIKVVYVNGYMVEENCILAECYDSNEVFQVIAIDGYYSGVTEGYIKKEFRDNRGNYCTWNHLESQLRERVFVELKSIEIIEEVTSTQAEFDKTEKILEKGGFKSPFQTDYEPE